MKAAESVIEQEC